MDISRLSRRLAREGMIAIFWSIEDVQEVRPDLTAEQAFEVLKQCEAEHDALVGLSWDIIEIHAENLFPKTEEEQP